ncbi:MAG: IS1380 family transposase [candidate division NC10 bacterium]|nr:IS1380 family transposase [candidate division NC10 bacterium]
MSTETPGLPFEIDDTIDPTLVTGRAGVPLVIELFRQLGVAQAIDAHVAVKQRQRGLSPSELVESLIVLWASGGDRCQDLATLREDQALATLLGHPLPAATTVRDFLEAFHREDGPLWAAGPAATIPLESAPLVGLGTANRPLVAGLQRGARARTATLDVDATLVESHKDAATVAYDGTRGYQPVVVLWAEQDVIVHDQFRDGHVPAGCGNVRVLEQAVGNLPQGITQLFLRADSALYETAVLRWCEARQIGYAISADMSTPLKTEILRLPEAAWQRDREEPDAVRAWAEVPYVPDDGDHRKDRPCVRRYLAVRVQKRQGQLFADGSSVHYFAVVTNRDENGLALLQWHRAKAGTVEHAHHVLKRELAAAALPSGKFGANAAWFRLNVLTYNLLTALKRLTLPGDLRTARPKRLRFLLFNTVGKVVAHARRTLLRLSGALQHALLVRAAEQDRPAGPGLAGD